MRESIDGTTHLPIWENEYIPQTCSMLRPPTPTCHVGVSLFFSEVMSYLDDEGSLTILLVSRATEEGSQRSVGGTNGAHRVYLA